MELWLVRHGRTTAGDEERFQGRWDVPLNLEGVAEAVQLSRRLANAGKFDLLLSSDLERAWQTANIISRAIKLAPLGEPLLRECAWGYIEGLERSEVEALYPFLLHAKSGTVRALRCGGESERRLLARARTLRRRISREHPGKNRILLVSHARLLNAFISASLGFTSRQKWRHAPAPASLSILKAAALGDACSLALFNDISHLQE